MPRGTTLLAREYASWGCRRTRSQTSFSRNVAFRPVPSRCACPLCAILSPDGAPGLADDGTAGGVPFRTAAPGRVPGWLGRRLAPCAGSLTPAAPPPICIGARDRPFQLGRTRYCSRSLRFVTGEDNRARRNRSILGMKRRWVNLDPSSLKGDGMTEGTASCAPTPAGRGLFGFGAATRGRDTNSVLSRAG